MSCKRGCGGSPHRNPFPLYNPDRIAIVDDDAALGRQIERIVRRAFPDQVVLTVTDGVAAYSLVERYRQQLQVVILDICMPGLDGRTVAGAIRRIAPGVRILPFTGNADAIPVLRQLGCSEPILKPFPSEQLPERIKAAIAAPIPATQSSSWIQFLHDQAAALVAYGKVAARPPTVEGLQSRVAEAADVMVVRRTEAVTIYGLLSKHASRCNFAVGMDS